MTNLLRGGAVCALIGMLAACGGGTDASGTSSSSIASTGSSSSSSTAGAPIATGSTTSASGSVIPNATQLIDASRNVWTLNNGVVEENGAAAGYSANVIALLYYGGVIYQESKTCLWWSWNGSAWVSTANPNPGTVPSCSSLVAAAATGNSADSIPNTAVAPTPTGEFGVQVRGDRLVSAKDGSPIEIVGTNFSGLETGMVWRWASFATAGTTFWSKVLNWNGSGVNAVRLPLNEASWLNYTCYDNSGAAGSFYTPIGGGAFQPDPKSAYQATVKKAVADATAAGLYVILDLHWGSPNNAVGQPLCPIGQPAYADADHSLAFWKSVADTFKSNPAVMFELFNEPFGSNVYTNWIHQSGSSYSAGPDAITLRDGGADYPFLEQDNAAGNAIKTVPITWHVAGMQAMVDTIRGEGAANVILSAPIGWAGEIETWLSSKPSDPIGQLGVSWHVYGYKKGQGPPQAVLAAGYPIVITETYGLGSIGGYGWAASQGIGYTWWGWNDWAGQALSAMLSRAPWFESTAP